MTIGTGDCRTMSRAVLRLCGQASIGPRLVADQSKERIRAPVSPPPAGKSLRWGDASMVSGAVISVGCRPAWLPPLYRALPLELQLFCPLTDGDPRRRTEGHCHPTVI